MHFTTTDTEIFELLESAGQDRFDMNQPLCTDFEFAGQFCFLLFCPGISFRGTLLYRIPLVSLGFELRHELIPQLLQLPEKGEMISLKTKALERVEALLSNGKMDSGFFDAH